MVTLQCPGCGGVFDATHEQVRTANDADLRLKCPDCFKPRRPVPVRDHPRTAAGVILAAAGSLPRAFPLADLVVAAWRTDPRRFGLAGHEYPDSNRVLMEVVKMSRPGGPLEKVAARTYRLTESGRLLLARERGAVAC